MIVYADVFMLISSLVNGILLWLPGEIAGEHCSKGRLLLGVVFSVLYGVLCFVIEFYSLPVSLVWAYLQILIVYRRKTLVLWGVYLAVAFTLAGWQQAFLITETYALLLFLCGVVLVLKLSKRLLKFLRSQNLRRQVHIEMDGKVIEFEGYIDSGNRLSAAVLNKELATCLLGEQTVSDMQNLMQTKVQYRLCNCTTVSGNGMIPLFKPDLLTVNGKTSTLWVGINFMPMQEKMLLPQNELEVL